MKSLSTPRKYVVCSRYRLCCHWGNADPQYQLRHQGLMMFRSFELAPIMWSDNIGALRNIPCRQYQDHGYGCISNEESLCLNLDLKLKVVRRIFGRPKYGVTPLPLMLPASVIRLLQSRLARGDARMARAPRRYGIILYGLLPSLHRRQISCCS
jgi:hypothetical protein